MDAVNTNEACEGSSRKPIGINEGDLEVVIVDGFLGFGLSAGCALLLVFSSFFNASDFHIASMSLLGGLVLSSVLLFLGGHFSDVLNEPGGTLGTLIAYVAAFVLSVVALCLRMGVVAVVCAPVALVCTFFLYGKFLGSLDRKILMILISILFAFTGFSVVVLSPMNELIRVAIVGAAAFLSVMVSVLFVRKKAPYDAFGNAEESKSRSIRVKGNNHTLFMIGFMCGGCALVPSLGGGLEPVVFTIAGSMGLAGVLSILLGQLNERLYKEMLLKSCALVTAICLLPAYLLDGSAKLVLIAVFLVYVFLNVIVLLNAVVETARFNLINPIWLLGHEGSVYFAGIFVGGALAVAGGYFANVDPEWLYVVLFLMVTICAYMQISVNYQAYPFEPIIETTPEEKAISQEITERNGQRKTLYQKKRQYACDLYSLSPREREILVTLLKGRDAKYIMDTFYISQSTAKTHIYNIYRKFDVHSRQELLDFIEEIELPPEEMEDVIPDEDMMF